MEPVFEDRSDEVLEVFEKLGGWENKAVAAAALLALFPASAYLRDILGSSIRLFKHVRRLQRSSDPRFEYEWAETNATVCDSWLPEEQHLMYTVIKGAYLWARRWPSLKREREVVVRAHGLRMIGHLRQAKSHYLIAWTTGPGPAEEPADSISYLRCQLVIRLLQDLDEALCPEEELRR